MGLLGGAPPFSVVATGTGGDHIFPMVTSSLRKGNHMIQCELSLRKALFTVLTNVLIAKKHILTAKLYAHSFFIKGNVLFKSKDTGELKTVLSAADLLRMKF